MREIRDMHDFVFRTLHRREQEEKFLGELNTIEHELLTGIINNRYKDDEDARKTLYHGAEPDSATIHRYRRSKSDIVSKLIDQFLKTSSSISNKFFINRVSSKKDLIAADILNIFGRQNAARFLALRVLKKSVKFHLTYESYAAYRLLSNYYAQAGPRSKFQKYSSMQNRYFEILHLEEKVANLRRSLRSEFTAKTGLQREALEKYRKHIDEFNCFVNEFQTRSVVRDLSIVESLVCRFEGRFDDALFVLDKARKFFLNNPELLTPRLIGSLNFACLRVCINKRDYLAAMHYATLVEESHDEGSFGWFQMLAAKMQLLFHTGQWNEATALFRQVVRHANFRASALRLELWAIFEGYLRAFVEDKRSLPANVTVHGEQFNILRLLQEFTVAHQDKTGLNIAVHIIHILHYLLNRKLELLDQRIAALQHYFNRHTRLRKDVRFRRVRTFVQMLVATRRAEFASDVTKLKVAEQCEFLREFAPTTGNEAVADQIQSVQVEEIVPYHLIWEKVQAELQKIDDERLITRRFRTSPPPQKRQQAQSRRTGRTVQ